MRLSDVTQPDRCLVTRVWGFSPESWGAMGFPRAGIADKWITRGETVRVVCFVSHHAADHIAEADRGRVLGVYELAPRSVLLETDGVLDPRHLDDPVMRHPDGRFRWPVGLPATRAWLFDQPIPKTREAMPDARRAGYDVSTDLVSISAQDFSLLDQRHYRLRETKVYGVDWSPTRITEPIAVPSSVYMFACARAEILKRLPGWRAGDILIKIGCTSDVPGRLNSFNDHPLARIFGLKLSNVAELHVGIGQAAVSEQELLAFATAIGRPASDLRTEFFFVSERAYFQLQQRFTSALVVA